MAGERRRSRDEDVRRFNTTVFEKLTDGATLLVIM